MNAVDVEVLALRNVFAVEWSKPSPRPVGITDYLPAVHNNKVDDTSIRREVWLGGVRACGVGVKRECPVKVPDLL